MRKNVENKIKLRLKFIQAKCFELSVLDFQHFWYFFSTKITTVNDEKKLVERLKNDHLHNQISSKAIMDKYFLEVAKLFEKYSKDETMSYPSICEILKKNQTHFQKIDVQKINSTIEKTDYALVSYQAYIEDVKQHRDKCLSHSDKVLKCEHLKEITTIDTRNIIKILIEFTDSLSTIFDYQKFPYDELEKVKHEINLTNYNRIKKMES